MGISKNKAVGNALQRAAGTSRTPTVDTASTLNMTPSAPPRPAPPPLQFAPRPATVQPYVTPPRIAGSGSGAQHAFASQQPAGYDPVQAFLSSLPPLGPAPTAQAAQVMPGQAPVSSVVPDIDPRKLGLPLQNPGFAVAPVPNPNADALLEAILARK